MKNNGVTHQLMMVLAYEASELGMSLEPRGAVLEYIKDNKKEIFAAYDNMYEMLAVDLIRAKVDKGIINLYATHEPDSYELKMLNNLSKELNIEEFTVFYDQPSKEILDRLEDKVKLNRIEVE